jgi:hypothetical protein
MLFDESQEAVGASEAPIEAPAQPEAPVEQPVA